MVINKRSLIMVLHLSLSESFATNKGVNDMNTYYNCCGSCKHLDTEDHTWHKENCKCTERGFYCKLDEKKCDKYEYDPNKDYDDLKRRW